MSEERALPKDLPEIKSFGSEFRRVARVFIGRKLVVFGLMVILALILTAISAPILAPYDPNEMRLNQTLRQPSWQHLLGTDTLGRDTLSRIIYGSRISLMIGIVAIGIATLIGISLGLVAGYFGNITHTIIMRFTDALMSFPPLLVALVLAALLGAGLRNVMMALGISLMPVYIRLMCGQVLSVKENDYVTAGRVTGASNLRIMLRHVLPNCLSPIIVASTLQIGLAILSEASLSFLGIGIEPPIAAWGGMVADGSQHLLTLPVLSFAPGLAIMLVVLSFNMVGDGLRDALDPRLRGTL
jgi:peptide/nickel transport system permease protein